LKTLCSKAISRPVPCQKDKPIKKKFDEALAADQMIRCERCRGCWFDVELKDDGICKCCHGKDDRKRPDEPFFYSKENHLDFGDVPDFLPALHPAEEMVIARVHVSVSVSVRFYVLLTFWLIFLLLLDSRSAIQISCTCCLFTFFEMLARFTRSYLCFPTSSSFTNQSVTLSQVVCDISDLLSRRMKRLERPRLKFFRGVYVRMSLMIF
jgi:uncharacterized protein DUF6570